MAYTEAGMPVHDQAHGGRQAAGESRARRDLAAYLSQHSGLVGGRSRTLVRRLVDLLSVAGFLLALCVVWPVVSVGAIASGTARLAENARYVAGTRSASAVVERVAVYARDADGDFREALVRFTTDDGREVTAVVRQTTSGKLVPDPVPGGTVEVRYEPHDPTAARLASFHELWLGPILLLPTGTLLGLLWVGWVLTSVRRSHPAATRQGALSV